MNEPLLEFSELAGWAILQSLWQGSIIGLIALMISRLIREAAIRHLVNLCGIIAIGVSFALSIIPEHKDLSREANSPSSSSPPVMSDDSPTGEAMAPDFVMVPDEPVPSIEITVPDPEIQNAGSELPWISLLAYAWVIGVAYLFLRHFIGYLAICRLRGRGKLKPPVELIKLAEEVREKLRIRKDVALFLSSKVAAPILTGVIKPIVFIPISAVNGLPRDELSAVLAHELAHFRRCDHWANSLQIFLETILFYHPVVWILGRAVRHDRELAADDLAIKGGTAKLDLAHALAAFAEIPPTKQAVGAANGPLLKRINRLAGKESPSRRSHTSMFATSGLILFLAGGLMTTFLYSPVFAQSETVISVKVGESIQDAIDSAETGTIIQLEEGIYPGRIKLTKPLTIRGAAWQKTSLLPSLEDDGDYSPTIEILEAKGVVFEDLRVSPHENPATGGGTVSRDYTIMVGLEATASFIRCAVVGPGSNGIAVTEESKLEMEECLVAAFWGTGIAIGRTQDDYGASQLYLERSAVRSCRHRGITLGSGCDKSVIKHNWISGSAWHGIRYDNASPRIEQNVIFDNERFGIYASGRTAATVFRNLFARNGMGGISGWYLNQDRVVQNVFVGNLREAIAVIGASQPILQNNLFFDEEVAVTCGGVAGGGDFSESAGAPLMNNNLLVGVSLPLSVKGETIQVSETNRVSETLPEVLPKVVGPAQSEEELAAYTSDQGPIAFLDLNPWNSILAEENRFWNPNRGAKNESKTKEPSSREIQDMRAAVKPWIDDIFQLEDTTVRERSIDLIREALQSDEIEEVRKGLLAFNQLASIRFDKASFHDLIVPLLDHSEIFVRDSAVLALGISGLQEGDLERLISMINDPSSKVKKSVAGQIVWGVDKDLTGEAAEAILTLLDDPSASFRKSIFANLWGAKHSPELEARIIELSRHNTDRYDALYYALSTQANKSRNTVERLIEYLPDIDTANVGHRAAWGLGQGVSESEHAMIADAAIKLVEARQGGLYRDGISLLKKYAGAAQRPELRRLLQLPGINEDFEKNLTEILEGIESNEEI
ncbi:MAG: M56 family metallopeptidase [Verrucomicrobiota bacterium]